jgi:hypothetical protein
MPGVVSLAPLTASPVVRRFRFSSAPEWAKGLYSVWFRMLTNLILMPNRAATIHGYIKRVLSAASSVICSCNLQVHELILPSSWSGCQAPEAFDDLNLTDLLCSARHVTLNGQTSGLLFTVQTVLRPWCPLAPGWCQTRMREMVLQDTMGGRDGNNDSCNQEASEALLSLLPVNRAGKGQRRCAQARTWLDVTGWS